MCDAELALRGHLAATFESRAGRTVADIAERAAPMELRGPLMRDGEPAFCLRNVSCGTFAGDEYDVRLRAAAGARAIVRATSATTVHAMTAGFARSRMALDSAPGGMLVHIEGPLILQRDSDLRQSVEITMRPGGVVAYAEIVVLGRMAHGEVARFRRFDNEIVVLDTDGVPRYTERFSLEPGRGRATILDASAAVIGTLVVVGVTDEDERWSGLALDGDGYVAGYDSLPDGVGVVLRCAGSKLEPIAALIDMAIGAVGTARDETVRAHPLVFARKR